jgi:hypothetical protein
MDFCLSFHKNIDVNQFQNMTKHDVDPHRPLGPCTIYHHMAY